MKLQLAVSAGPDSGRVFELVEGSCMLGRGAGAKLQVSDRRVSREQCLIEVSNGTAEVIDAGSASGTFVNGLKVDRLVLKPGDEIKVGDSTLRFDVGGSQGQSTLMSVSDGVRQPAKEPTRLPDLVGETIHGFRIVCKIAEGRTGTVFKARDESKERDVALKVLWPEISKNEEDMQRFLRAMKTMFPLRHENIVRIYNAGTSGRHSWVALEYVDGESMARVIERIGTAGMLDWEYAYRVAVHIARALEVAFEHKIVHRSISPENILMRSSDKVVKLGDMMLAKALEGNQAEQITRQGQLIGELVYMSPERTKSTGGADCRSDIYSLGATCYALLTGRPPFEADSLPALMLKIRNEEPESPKKYQLSINDMFAGCVKQMLAKDPANRYATPSALLKDLDRIGKFAGVPV